MTDAKLPIITASRLKTARSCLRLHKYKYFQGYRPVGDNENLRFGTLFHQCLEAWWLAKAAGQDALEASMAVAEKASADEYDCAKVSMLLVGYTARWGAEEWEVLGVEVPFETALINPDTGAKSRTWRLAGKIDAIVSNAKGETYIVEHKTSSEDVSSGSDYWRRLKLDGQLSVYNVGAMSLGYELSGALYDVIKKPTIRPAKATPVADRKYTKGTAKEPSKLYANQREFDESPAEYAERIANELTADPNKYFARGYVVRLEAELDEAMADVWQTAEAIRHAELTGRHTRNPDSCFKYGSNCAFVGVCCGEASLDDGNLFLKLDSVHPELDVAAA